MVITISELNDELAFITRQIEGSQDRYDLDSFNSLYAERERLYRERDDLFALLGGV